MTTDIDRRTRFETIAGVVYEPLQRYLRRRASSDDADDAFSETLLTLWRRLDDIPGDAVLPYAYGVARRVLSNQRRASGRRLRLMERVASSTETTVPGPEDQDIDPEVRAALATLPEADREVLVLWAWEQLEPREIAVVLDTTANAISLRLTRAKAKLANALEGQDVDGSGHKQVETTEEHRP